MSNESETHEHYAKVTIGFVIVAVILTSFVWYAVSSITPSGTFLEILVSIILTLIVAIIYYHQLKIQEEQAQITREQKNVEQSLKDLQSQPALEVISKDPIKTGWKVHVGNFGFGPLHSLELILDIDIDGSVHKPKTTCVKLQKNFGKVNDRNATAGSLMPKSEVETFYAKDLDIKTQDSECVSFPTLFEELSIHADDDCSVNIDLLIQGKDAFENLHEADAGNYELIIGDLSGVSNYNIDTVLSYERN